MKVTFLMPGYSSAPSGGYRVIYEYANRLVARGHGVTVVHPRELKFVQADRLTLRQRIRRTISRFSKPSINWQPIDQRVELLFVPTSEARFLPDADALFATGWHTVQSVLECPPTKGARFYFIQGYESYHADKELVDATWRAPLHKIVIAKWLVELGRELGCGELPYIPNAINHDLYRLLRPIEGRTKQIAMLFSTAPIKGAADGIEALRIVREKHSDLRVVFFGVSRRPAWMPPWAQYYRNPPQQFLIDDIYNRSCIFVAPSWTEGSPLPPAEASACGCAVVATNIGGFREYIYDGLTGLLSPPKDPTALAQNILRLIENDELRVQLASAANQCIGQFNWERSVTLLENRIVEVIRGQSPPRSG